MWGACSGGGVIAAALSFGLALMVFAASFGHISGVHFNPAVTIGVLIAGEMQAVMAILYVVMQLLGGKSYPSSPFNLPRISSLFRYCCWWYLTLITRKSCLQCLSRWCNIINSLCWIQCNCIKWSSNSLRW